MSKSIRSARLSRSSRTTGKRSVKNSKKETNFHGFGKKHAFFEGWYIKHQKENTLLALIPAFHVDENGRKTASLQIITNDGSEIIYYTEEEFYAAKNKFYVRIGDTVVTEAGIKIHIHTDKIKVDGTISYHPFHRPSSDLMGPLRFVPMLQCSHGVVSFSHKLSGSVCINNKRFDFQEGTGYIEKDWGSSFPKRYFWTQCSWGRSENCVMAAKADVVLPPGITFTGCICALRYHGKEYRLATYQGARILRFNSKELVIRQGRKLLTIRPAEQNGFLLRAPKEGAMSRGIFEIPAGVAQYTFQIGKKVVFDFISSMAGLETVEN